LSKPELSKRRSATILMTVLVLVLAAGCKKKAPIAAAPAPPPPPPPPIETAKEPVKAPVIAQFTAEPSSIERGQAATLRWSVSDATSVTIEPGLGTVQSNGNRQVFPSNSTSYRLTASGPGGNASASATVNVVVPPPPPAAPPADKKPFTSRIETEVTDAYFDYDSSDIREDARNALTRDADSLKTILRDFPNNSIVVEGHCDERGSAEYNLGLGDRRATAAKEFMIQLGIPGDRLKTISYGKERPQCSDPNEGCWQKNRRAHFAGGQ
jgi:peptidoglycan-associated lipoprotein